MRMRKRIQVHAYEELIKSGLKIATYELLDV